MIRTDTYFFDSSSKSYLQARERKEELKTMGFRVKIRKNSDGIFEIFKKNIQLIDWRRR